MSLQEIFANPGAAVGLLLVPLLWFLFRSLDTARESRLSRIVGPRSGLLARRTVPALRRGRRWLALGALTLAVIAAMPLAKATAASALSRSARAFSKPATVGFRKRA